MSERLTRYTWVAAFVATVVALFFGCGRSSLDEGFSALTDAGVVDVRLPDVISEDVVRPPPDGGCTPMNCLNGCCDSTGACRVGSDDDACGTLGVACEDCRADGFDACDSAKKACVHNTAEPCSPKNCMGCCQDNMCFGGKDLKECGALGAACVDCTGQSCDGRTCVGPKCGPGNCNGCCAGERCVTGLEGTACGLKGMQCTNCLAQNQVCAAVVPGQPGGVCEGMASCSPLNCNGCCDGNTCDPGTDKTACGLAGQPCQNCQTLGGGSTCDLVPGGGGVCRPPRCGPDNCMGCCLGDTCLNGNDMKACGIKGAQCQLCGGDTVCMGGTCQGACDPTNCAGCCVNGVCAIGTQSTACGTMGQTCQNCAANGGQACVGGSCQVVCGPMNCTGCCQNNVCVGGKLDAECGIAGQKCQDCTLQMGDICKAGSCVPPPPPCDPAACAARSGCCDPQLGCVFGATDDRCGSSGQACINCKAMMSTCDTAVKPFVCQSQQMSCPAAYPMCPGGVATGAPQVQHVCTDADLQQAHAACINGQDAAACQAFFSFESQGMSAACGKCLAPFNAPFTTAAGVFACLAPFLSGGCNHNTGCVEDCLTKSCSMCTADAQAACITSVGNGNGQCATFFNQSACVFPALFGPGTFCNPQNYRGSYADWLLGVGTHYCGP
jgi:hypothetical protein